MHGSVLRNQLPRMLHGRFARPLAVYHAGNSQYTLVGL